MNPPEIILLMLILMVDIVVRGGIYIALLYFGFYQKRGLPLWKVLVGVLIGQVTGIIIFGIVFSNVEYFKQLMIKLDQAWAYNGYLIGTGTWFVYAVFSSLFMILFPFLLTSKKASAGKARIR